MRVIPSFHYFHPTPTRSLRRLRLRYWHGIPRRWRTPTAIVCAYALSLICYGLGNYYADYTHAELFTVPVTVIPVAAPAEAASSASQTPAPAPVPPPPPPVRYANTYARGNCTWYVASRRNIPSNWGNANTWYYRAQLAGYKVGTAPAVGAIAWSGAGRLGHVAYVESINGASITVSEMNWNWNFNRVTRRTVPAATFRYIY